MPQTDTAELRRLWEAATNGEPCESCGGSGVEQSGVCHCGAEMEGHSAYDNHMATEMTRRCELCDGGRTKWADCASSLILEHPSGSVIEDLAQFFGPNWKANLAFAVAAHNALPALLDELEAAREEVEFMRNDRDGALYFIRLNGHELQHADQLLAARDRRQKLIGAAEELELLIGNWRNMRLEDYLPKRAAQLRQEAGDGK